MTLLEINLTDVLSETDPDDKVIVWAPVMREGPAGQLVGPRRKTIPLTDGVGSDEVVPGPLMVQVQCKAMSDTRPREVVVPEEGPVTLTALFDSAGAFTYTPVVVSKVGELTAQAREAADRVGTAEQVGEWAEQASTAAVSAQQVATTLPGQVPPLVSAALADDPVVKAGADAAVTDAVEGLDLMERTAAEGLISTKADQAEVDEMAPLHEAAQVTPSDGFRVRDKLGTVALSVTAEGDTSIGGHVVRPSSDVAFRIRDQDGSIALEVANDGTITGLSGGEAEQRVEQVHVIIAAGQSNMAGYATPISETLDPPHPRIWQYGAKSQQLGVATVPLDGIAHNGGLSPATVFAREYIQALPDTSVVVIVPAAVGDTGFIDRTKSNWNVDETDPDKGLFTRMITATQAALQAAENRWNVTPRMEALLWHQGEADANTYEAATYTAALDEVFTEARTRLNAPSLPIVLGQLVPENVATVAHYEWIDATHQSTPSRLPHAVFVPGLVDSGRNPDTWHYSRAGIEHLGSSMFRQLNTARGNDPTRPAQPVLHLRAEKAGGIITATWQQPYCRISSYLIEWADTAGTWAALPAQSVPGKCSAELPAGAVQVRVSTVTPTETSRPTRPVNIQGV